MPLVHLKGSACFYTCISILWTAERGPSGAWNTIFHSHHPIMAILSVAVSKSTFGHHSATAQQSTVWVFTLEPLQFWVQWGSPTRPLPAPTDRMKTLIRQCDHTCSYTKHA